MSEKVKILITNVDESTSNGKTYYNCFTSMGVKYTSTDPQVKQYIGVEHEFDITIVEKNGNTNRWINFPKPGGGGFQGGGKKNFTPFVPAFKDTREGFIASNKNMLLSYSKDLANTYSQVLIPKSFNEVLDNVKTAFEALSAIAKLDEIPAAPIPAQNISVQAQTTVPEYHLKPVLETILKGKFKSNNLNNNRDIIEYCAAFGIEIKNDTNSGDVFINKLSENDANLLINELNRS